MPSHALKPWKITLLRAQAPTELSNSGTKLASFVKRRSARAVHVDFEHHAKAALRVIDLNDYLSGRPEPPPALLHYALAVRLANKGDVSELVDRLWLANAAGTQREAVRMSDREIPARKWLTVPVDRDRFGDLDGGFVAVAELAGHPREIRSDVEHLRDDIVQEVLESRVANGY